MANSREPRPEHKKTIEELSELDKKNLISYQQFLIKLLKFIRKDFQPIYAELLDAQKSADTPENLGVIAAKFAKPLSEFAAQETPSFWLSAQLQQVIGTPVPQPADLLQGIRDDVALTITVKLDNDKYHNPFRLSHWIEKISDLQVKISNIIS
jgi:hypothetical protein